MDFFWCTRRCRHGRPAGSRRHGHLQHAAGIAQSGGRSGDDCHHRTRRYDSSRCLKRCSTALVVLPASLDFGGVLDSRRRWRGRDWRPHQDSASSAASGPDLQRMGRLFLSQRSRHDQCGDLRLSRRSVGAECAPDRAGNRSSGGSTDRYAHRLFPAVSRRSLVFRRCGRDRVQHGMDSPAGYRLRQARSSTPVANAPRGDCPCGNRYRRHVPDFAQNAG